MYDQQQENVPSAVDTIKQDRGTTVILNKFQNVLLVFNIYFNTH